MAKSEIERRGGKRPGAGRPKQERTVQIRVPEGALDAVRDLVEQYKAGKINPAPTIKEDQTDWVEESKKPAPEIKQPTRARKPKTEPAKPAPEIKQPTRARKPKTEPAKPAPEIKKPFKPRRKKSAPEIKQLTPDQLEALDNFAKMGRTERRLLIAKFGSLEAAAVEYTHSTAG